MHHSIQISYVESEYAHNVKCVDMSVTACTNSLLLCYLKYDFIWLHYVYRKHSPCYYKNNDN